MKLAGRYPVKSSCHRSHLGPERMERDGTLHHDCFRTDVVSCLDGKGERNERCKEKLNLATSFRPMVSLWGRVALVFSQNASSEASFNQDQKRHQLCLRPLEMPMERTISLGSSSSSAPKRKALPFKPPGPAKKAKLSDTFKAATKAKTATTSTSAPSRPKGKHVATVISSEDEDDEEDEAQDSDDYGVDITFDLEPPELQAPSHPPLSKPPPTTTSARSNKRKSIPFDLSDSDDLPSDPEDLIAAPRRVRSADTESNATTANNTSENEEEAIPGIQPQLLTRLLHENFDDKTLRISKAANSTLCKYVDIFVREAVARAALEKREERRRNDKDDWTVTALDEEVFLDVEDLEKVAGGLVLDF